MEKELHQEIEHIQQVIINKFPSRKVDELINNFINEE